MAVVLARRLRDGAAHLILTLHVPETALEMRSRGELLEGGARIDEADEGIGDDAEHKSHSDEGRRLHRLHAGDHAHAERDGDRCHDRQPHTQCPYWHPVRALPWALP